MCLCVVRQRGRGDKDSDFSIGTKFHDISTRSQWEFSKTPIVISAVAEPLNKSLEHKTKSLIYIQ